MNILSLPYDLQEKIYTHVLELRKPKQAITKELREDIETFGFLSIICTNYEKTFGSDFITWVENAIILIMNDYNGLAFGISQDLRNTFPNLSDMEIRSKLINTYNLNKLWINMSPTKRYTLTLCSKTNHIPGLQINQEYD